MELQRIFLTNRNSHFANNKDEDIPYSLRIKSRLVDNTKNRFAWLLFKQCVHDIHMIIVIS